MIALILPESCDGCVVIYCVMADQEGDSTKRALSGRSGSTGSLQGVSRRVMDSASGLLQETLSPNNVQATSTLAHVLASEDKAESSTRAEAARPGTLIERSSGSSMRQIGSSPGTEVAFRELVTSDGNMASPSAKTAKVLSLDEFMNNAREGGEVLTEQRSSTARAEQITSGTDSLNTAYPVLDAEMSAAWDATVGSRTFQAVPKNTYMKTAGANANGIYQVAQVDDADGADVLKLLQDPETSFWTDMPEEDDQEIPCTITEQDMRIAEDLVRCVSTSTASKSDCETVISAAKNGKPFSEFLSFFDEIENYQNEVWGYLRPLVKEAKRQNREPGAFAAEGTATRRLRMILAHVDESW